jgi:hypothetical protein
MFVTFALYRLWGMVGSLAIALCLAVAADETAAQPAKPFPTLEHYMTMHEGSEHSRDTLSALYRLHEGLLDGVLAASEAYNQQGAPRRFCPPADAEFNIREPFFKMLAAELMANGKNYGPPEKVSMGALTMFALQRRFPCK